MPVKDLYRFTCKDCKGYRYVNIRPVICTFCQSSNIRVDNLTPHEHTSKWGCKRCR